MPNNQPKVGLVGKNNIMSRGDLAATPEMLQTFWHGEQLCLSFEMI